MIETWINSIIEFAEQGHDIALEFARCGSLVKGYGDTRSRTTSQVLTIIDHARRRRLIIADEIAKLRSAALADDEGRNLEEALAANA